MAFPCKTTGSLSPTFVPARRVCLAVKLPFAIALYARLPSVLREPLKASDTFLEATTPVKLPTKQCSRFRVRLQPSEGWYFNVGSPIPSDTGSQPPTYPTHPRAEVSAKL
jgi:hypothetical protein